MWIEDLIEMRQLLKEMYQRWEKEADDHHCKSSEAAVSLHFPPFFWREDNNGTEPAVEVYSYVFSSRRNNYFDTSKAAVEAVRRWHKKAMADDYYDHRGLFEDEE